MSVVAYSSHHTSWLYRYQLICVLCFTL